MAQMKLSTGVLSRDPVSFNAHVHVSNLTPTSKRKVMVEVFDWGVDQVWDTPVPVPVSPSGTVVVGPHCNQSFLALINQSTAQPSLNLAHYEVRITVSDIKNVVVNCFALDSDTHVIPGNSVLHGALVEIT